ncbi:hypothetical protein BKA70DRAFT_1238327 [Coprinopsis sp. MPI-PUGE-AT-0042]|nr:hypothetical protein BKA70DRAFT_1238327 [Coprinopsis sp. MPI-PUGE-AT-0042]
MSGNGLSNSSRYAIVRSCLGRILTSHTTNKKQRTFGRQVLQYDYRSESLSIWFWPVYDSQDEAVQRDPSLENARVPPSDLEEYRRKHTLKAPCCLCALMDDVPYTESRIGLAGTESSRTGTYIAECAQNRCGYYVYLEDFYPVLGLRIRKYARRDISIPEGSALPAVRTPRRWAMKIGKEGVSERDFWITIVQCPRCRWLLPSLDLLAHVCKSGPPRSTEVIDLTEED